MRFDYTVTAAAALCAAAAFFPQRAEASADLAGRAARSVHLRYAPSIPVAEAKEVRANLTVRETAPGTFFACLGFDCGYYGVQDLPDGRKILIFSVWDPGDRFDFNARPDRVSEELRVKELFATPGARVRRFGGEGTGAQMMMDFMWEIGVPVKLRVTAEPDGGDRTAFTAWCKRGGGDSAWERVATFSTLHDGGYPFSSVYSFIEDFRRNGESALRRRSADFTEVAFCAGEGKPWVAAESAVFSADGNPSNAIDARPVSGGWSLATGGDTVNDHAKLGQRILRMPESSVPEPLLK